MSILLNNLYKILDEHAEPGSFDVAIEIDRNHPIFQGHFPGNPVLPGACMIQIVEEILSHLLNKQLRCLEASNIKFLSVLNPEIESFVHVTGTMAASLRPSEAALPRDNVRSPEAEGRENDILKVTAKISKETSVFLSFRGTFL